MNLDRCVFVAILLLGLVIGPAAPTMGQDSSVSSAVVERSDGGWKTSRVVTETRGSRTLVVERQPRALDAVNLPISLERIQRQLDRLPVATDERVVLRLSLYVRVYARASRINVFEGFDLHNGPVPYGAATHAMMQDVTTPTEFRSPAMTIGNMLRWTWK